MQLVGRELNRAGKFFWFYSPFVSYESTCRWGGGGGGVMLLVGMGNPWPPALSDIPDTDVNHTGIPTVLVVRQS